MSRTASAKATGTVRLRARLEALGDMFWLRPAALVALGVALGEAAVLLEPKGDPETPVGGWLFAGGEAGARELLSVVAGSAIGVAGTIFSITVAALSLASAQMGPRLLRSFVRDPGNQIALGIFVGAFAYCLTVLRTVRSASEGLFVPHLGVTGALALALLCVGTLVWFVHHVASSINVETVIEAVHADLCAALSRLSLGGPDPDPSPALEGGSPVTLQAGGYVQAVESDALADWASPRGVRVGLRVRPGHYVPFGAPLADVVGTSAGDAGDAIRSAVTLGPKQTAAQDLEFTVRQLAEVAVRALSSGINDPITAGAVLDRFGDALCRLASRRLPDATRERNGVAVVSWPATDYDGLCGVMFHLVRQSGSSSSYVLIRMLEVLARVAEVELRPERRAVLRRHADLAVTTGRRDIADEAGLETIEARHRLALAALDRRPGPES